MTYHETTMYDWFSILTVASYFYLQIVASIIINNLWALNCYVYVLSQYHTNNSTSTLIIIVGVTSCD